MSSVAIRPTSVPALQRMNTLQTLWAGLYLIWALDAMLLFAAITGVQVHRDAMKTVGKDTAPSIIAAQKIKTSMADMDASVANELLGKPGEMEEQIKDYEKRRVEASKALIDRCAEHHLWRCRANTHRDFAGWPRNFRRTRGAGAQPARPCVKRDLWMPIVKRPRDGLDPPSRGRCAR